MSTNQENKMYNEILDLFSENENLVKKINVALNNKLNKKIARRDLNLDIKDLKVEPIDKTIDKEDLVGDSAKYYYNDIFSYSLTGNDNDDKLYISRLMPKKNCYNYEMIIIRLIADFKLEILEYQKEIYRIKNECSEEELADYNNFILEFKKKIKFIQEIYRERIDENADISSLGNEENKIIFMYKNMDKSYGYKDLLNIPVDYYDSFLELLNSIRNGTFKNIKYLGSNNSKLCGIYEVKDFKIRILFDRLEPNVYCILAFFMKKSDNDRDYREFCINRIATYRVKKEGIIESLNDSDTFKINEETLDSIINLLSNHNIVDDNQVEYKGDVR